MKKVLIWLTVFCTNFLTAQERILGMAVHQDDLRAARAVTQSHQLVQDEIVAAHFLEKWIYAKVVEMPTEKVLTCLVTKNESHSWHNFAIYMHQLRKLPHPENPASSK